MPTSIGARSSAKPLSAESFAVQFTMGRCAHDKLRYAQELLRHQVPSGDIAEVFERALDVLIPQLEKRKFAATNGAECTFGVEFMRHKRLAAAEARAEAKAHADAARAKATVAAHVLEVVPWRQSLGFNAQESRDAAELCRDMLHASLEERVRAALSYFRPRGTRVVRPVNGLETAHPRAGLGTAAAGP